LALFVDDSEYINHFRNMKDVIIEGLKTQNPGIYSKYGWMKTKWNSTVHKYQQNQLLLDDKPELSEYFLKEILIRDSM
jgi:hypothetical protein